MSVYSFRRYRSGDEGAINDLYFKVTGRRRTARQHSWQWLEAPGGAGEMWLIEETNTEGLTKLIAHHGVMPTRFTTSDGALLLFGKTENTFVDPDYRKKILYTRFERKFYAEYFARFDGMFSTIGPPSALRQRKAMGYSFPVYWETYYLSLGLFSGLHTMIGSVIPKRTKRLEAYPSMYQPGRNQGVGHRFYSDANAVNLSFFDDFWSYASPNYLLAPARYKEDLDWRFWANPNRKYITYVLDEKEGCDGYAILSQHHSNNEIYNIDDIAIRAPTVEGYVEFFKHLKKDLKKIGLNGYLRFITTSDRTALSVYLKTLKYSKEALSWKLYKQYSNKEKIHMPRKLISTEVSDCVEDAPWDVTGILLEGR